MKIGFIGLGKMGFSMSLRLLKHGHCVVGFDLHPAAVKKLARKGAVPASSVQELMIKLGRKKIVWLMLPAGKATNNTLREVLQYSQKGDIIINGANAFYQVAQQHERWCKKKGVYFFDAGVSGGIWGLQRGYALMMGGPKKQLKRIEPFCQALAPKHGYGYFGPAGSGHYVKSIHNIIEYVMLEGLAEGVELLAKKKINYYQAAKVWQSASIITSSLLDWMVVALGRADFKKLKPKISSVTLEELSKTVTSVKGFAPAFEKARGVRCCTPSGTFALGKKIIAGVRREFGGHTVGKRE